VNRSFTEAVRFYRKAAEQGDVRGQSNLGFAYSLGLGVTRDDTAALKWWRTSAENGFSDAQAKLGELYSTGRQVEKDYVQAASWYRKGAEQGNVKAQAGLGTLYEKGLGVAQNEAEAIAWFRKAAAQGSSEATLALSRLGTEDQKLDRSTAAPASNPADAANKAPVTMVTAKDLETLLDLWPKASRNILKSSIVPESQKNLILVVATALIDRTHKCGKYDLVSVQHSAGEDAPNQAPEFSDRSILISSTPTGLSVLDSNDPPVRRAKYETYKSHLGNGLEAETWTIKSCDVTTPMFIFVESGA
jgi:hypothetical protein